MIETYYPRHSMNAQQRLAQLEQQMAGMSPPHRLAFAWAMAREELDLAVEFGAKLDELKKREAEAWTALQVSR